jgi:uncharacterized transporter YbjL
MIWGPMAVLFIATAGLLKDLVLRLPVCIFHEITGLPCVTCGGTRSLIALSQLDLVSSFIFNPLVPAFAFGLILFSLLFFIGAITKKSLKINLTRRGKRVIRYSVLIIIALNWAFLIVVGR